MKKLNKITLSLASVAAVAAPIAAVVSCGSAGGAGFNGRVDTAMDGEITIETSWASNANYFRAFGNVVDKYNELNKNEAGFIPVALRHVQGGYGDSAAGIVKKLKAGDSQTLPNMFIDYASGLSQMQAYEMDIDLNKEENKVNATNIDAQAVEINNNIGGTPSGYMGSIPLAVSAQSMLINKPLLGYMLAGMTAAGAHVDASVAGGVIATAQDALTHVSNADKATIVANWGAQITAADSSLSTYQINEDTFNSYEKLFEFGEKVQALYGKGSHPTEMTHVIGIDSPTTLVQNITSSLAAKTEYDKLVSKDSKNYLVNNWLHDGTKAQAGIKKALEMVAKGLNTGGLWVGGGGAYASNYFKEHKMAFTMGSTAGYKYNFQDATTTLYKLAEGLKVTDTITVPSGGTYDPAPGTAVAAFKSGTYTNYFYKSTTSMEKTSHGTTTPFGKLQHNYQIVDAANDTAITESSYVYIKNDDDKQAVTTAGGTKIKLRTSYDGKTAKEVDAWVWTSKPTGLLEFGSNLVNETDLMIKPKIQMSALATGTDKVVFQQGPGLVGVHANDAEDKATAMFMNWLYSTTKLAWEGETNQLTPAEYFSTNSGYIVPVKNYTTTMSTIATNAGKGVETSLHALAELKETGVKSSTLPVDETSAPLRKYLDAAIDARRDGVLAGQTTNAAEIYNDLASKTFWDGR